MKRVAGIFASVLLAGLALQAYAEPNSQQTKMADCNKQAEGKKGDERKAFMSTCLKKDSEPKVTPQQAKMKQCNKDAGDKKGDERKAFMSNCLKKSPA